jgi:endonuclease G
MRVYDRGHQAPSEDFNFKSAWMKETFVLSNAVPQVGPGFNQHIWAELEQTIRDLFETQSRNEIFVITGPIYQDPDGRTLTISANANACGNVIKLVPMKKASICDANNRNPRTPCAEAGVAVPAALYKIIYDPELERSNAFLMPNVDHRDSRGTAKSIAYLNKHRTSVSVIEEYTGLQFFTALQSRERRRLVERCLPAMIR